MFVFKFLELKSKGKPVSQSPDPGTDHDFYSLNKTVFLIEVAVILVLAPLDYLLFCVILKKSSIPK
jgi:hypothetical protein